MPLMLTAAAAGSVLFIPPKEPNTETGARAGEGSNMSQNGSGSAALARVADDKKEEDDDDEKGEKREGESGVVGAEVRFDELGVSYK